MRSSDLSKVLPGAFVPREVRKALYAIRNASRESVTADDVEVMLRTGRGRPTHLQALFGDLSAARLMAAGAALGIGPQTIIAAYQTAKGTVDAVSFELDALGI